jgi:LmbE family N-acetylglucosaminyl deacetylase
MAMSRRALLAGAALVGLRAAGPKLKVMVTGGHPGDPEYGCGGTIARYADQGHDVTLRLSESR